MIQLKPKLESCPSGRRCSTRNAVLRKGPRVRISYSPPYPKGKSESSDFFNTIMKPEQKIIYANQRDWILTLSSITLFLILGFLLIYEKPGPAHIILYIALMYFSIEQFIPRKKFILYENGLWIRHYGFIPYSAIEKVGVLSTCIKLHKSSSIELHFKDLSFTQTHFIFPWRKHYLLKNKTINIDPKNEAEFKTAKNKISYRVKKNKPRVI